MTASGVTLTLVTIAQTLGHETRTDMLHFTNSGTRPGHHREDKLQRDNRSTLNMSPWFQSCQWSMVKETSDQIVSFT